MWPSFLNAFGVFQSYYEKTLDGVTPSDISWIGSVQSFLIMGGNLFTGSVLDRYGPQPLLLFATVTMPFSCMMTSLTHSYWQVMLAEGVLQGLALSSSFMAPMTCVMWWFPDGPKKFASIAITVSGSSLGGVVWPIIVHALITNVGFAWTWRALGFIFLGLLGTATCLVTSPRHPGLLLQRERIPRSPHHDLPFLWLELFKHTPFVLTAVGLFWAWLGLFYIFFYLPSLGATRGLSPSMQFYCVSILNAASVFGRLALPMLSIKTGPFNLITVSMLGSAVVTWCSIATTNAAGVLVLGAFYGFISGAMISLLAPCGAVVTPDKRRLGTATGQLALCIGVASLIGSPIDGWIIDSSAGFDGAAGFSGACLALGACFAFAARLVINRTLFAAI